MGILPDLKRDGYNIKELRIVDAQGRRIGGFNVDIFRKAAHGRYVPIPRTDLAKDIYRKVGERCEIIFGDSIAAIEQDTSGVDVTFEHALPRRFDMVIGADGLHSIVRKLKFGEENHFEKSLGYSVAAFEVTGYRPRDQNMYMKYRIRGKQVGRLSLRNDRTLFLFVFAVERGDVIDSNDTQSQREILRAQFGKLGWECRQILAAMDSCPELYFDRFSRIRMNTWSKGRVGLIGDAAFAPSLLWGQGSALAMIAAYVLAGESSRTPNSPEPALMRYERLLHPFMLAKQEAAEKFATSFTPKTRLKLFLRNQITKAFAIPFVAKLVMGGSLLDRIDLPEYSEKRPIA